MRIRAAYLVLRAVVLLRRLRLRVLRRRSIVPAAVPLPLPPDAVDESQHMMGADRSMTGRWERRLFPVGVSF